MTTSTPPESTTSAAPASTTPGTAPDVEIWAGDIAGQMIEFQFTVDDTGTIAGLVTSPSVETPDLPITGTVEGAAVTIKVPAVEVVFEGEIAGTTMNGTWYQSGAEVPATFELREAPLVLARPQEPAPPFPYKATDVRFENGDVSLAGTLVVPDGEGPFPAVVFTSGSGSQDRDETIVGHKPFLVLSDAFALAGIASLRFDDRGVGGSTGDPVGATSADLATDTAAAIQLLADDGRFDSIGIVGHSEGGIIGPMVANDSDAVDLVVLLAGPGLPGLDVLLRQTEDLMRIEGASEADIAWQLSWRQEIMEVSASGVSEDEAAEAIRTIVSAALQSPPTGVTETVDPAMTEQFVTAFTDPWMRYFLSYDPAPALEDLDIPALALIGSLDVQVSAEENIPALEAALATNADATVSELRGLNHLFQNAETGAVSEYTRIEETFSPEAIDLITAWILEQS
ncbi:MAG: alpha/beta hydrolase [Acidimicrobiia bacterium]